MENFYFSKTLETALPRQNYQKLIAITHIAQSLLLIINKSNLEVINI